MAGKNMKGAMDELAGKRKQPPRPLFRLHKVASGKTYCLVSTDQLGGGATCTINDGTGELIIQSDWGTWAHQWSTDPSHLGAPSLSAFLRAHDRTDYVWDKLHYGRPREEFDQDATLEFLRSRIMEGVEKEADLDEDMAELMDELDELRDPCSQETFIDRCSSEISNLLGDQLEHVVMVELHGSILLREVILPSLWAALRQPEVKPDRRAQEREALLQRAMELNEKLKAELDVDAKLAGRVEALEAALRKYGKRLCGFNCQPENPAHAERCGAAEHNAAVEFILAERIP